MSLNLKAFSVLAWLGVLTVLANDIFKIKDKSRNFEMFAQEGINFKLDKNLNLIFEKISEE